MQIRKLVKSGNSSLVVAVPRQWVKSNKLKPGDIVYVEEDANKLKISKDIKQEISSDKGEIVIDIDGKNKLSIMRELAAAYVDNFRYIIVKGKTLNKMLDVIKKSITELVAVEIVEESCNKVIIRNFINIYDVDLRIVSRRIDNIIRAMFAEIKDCFKNPALADTIYKRDAEVNKLSFLLFKMLKAAYLNKNILEALKLEELDILRYWELAIHLEKIGDRVKEIAKIAPTLNEARRKKFLQLMSDVEKLYLEAMNAFHEFSPSIADSVSDRRLGIFADIQKTMKENKECSACFQIYSRLSDIPHNINDICRIIRFLR